MGVKFWLTKKKVSFQPIAFPYAKNLMQRLTFFPTSFIADLPTIFHFPMLIQGLTEFRLQASLS